MLKLVGMCMTLGACGTMGLMWARVYEKRPRQLAALEEALLLLETEITYGSTPLPEAMELVSRQCYREVASVFRQTAVELKKMEGSTANEAWVRSVDAFYPGSALTDSDLQIMRRFGVSLGNSDREDQMKHLALARSQLKAAADQADAAARKTASVFKYLGFLGGLFVVLVLY